MRVKVSDLWKDLRLSIKIYIGNESNQNEIKHFDVFVKIPVYLPIRRWLFINACYDGIWVFENFAPVKLMFVTQVFDCLLGQQQSD